MDDHETAAGRQRFESLAWTQPRQMLFALGAAAGIGIALAAYEAHKQTVAVAALAKIGCDATHFDMSHPRLTLLELLRRLLGDADARNVTQLNADGTRLTDAELVYVRNLSHLRWLNLAGAQVTDDGLAQLDCPVELRLLCLSGTQVTDAGAEKIKRALPDCQIVR